MEDFLQVPVVPWEKYFQVIPARNPYADNSPPGKARRVGKISFRSVQLGFRFFATILEGVDGRYFAVLPRYQYKPGQWAEYFTFDVRAERISFLNWAVDVWIKALVDGEGILPHRVLGVVRYAYYPVTSEGHITQNPRAESKRLPWDNRTTGRSYRSDIGTEEEITGGDEEGEVGPGDVEGHSSETELPSPEHNGHPGRVSGDVETHQ